MWKRKKNFAAQLIRRSSGEAEEHHAKPASAVSTPFQTGNRYRYANLRNLHKQLLLYARMRARACGFVCVCVCVCVHICMYVCMYVSNNTCLMTTGTCYFLEFMTHLWS
jgi:hypothetical protein